MPPKRNKEVIKKYYTEIPNCNNYLLSNYGEVIKKSTWKKISVINNVVTISADGKRIALSVVKLLRELFTLHNIPTNYNSIPLTNKINNKKDVIRATIKQVTSKEAKKYVAGNSKVSNWRERITPEYVRSNNDKVKSMRKIRDDIHITSKRKRDISFRDHVNILRRRYDESVFNAHEHGINTVTNWYNDLLASCENENEREKISY